MVFNPTPKEKITVEIITQLQVPPYLKIGDILFCEWKHYNTDPCWDHLAIYIGDNKFIESTPVGRGVVRITELEWFSQHTKAICYGNITTANLSQKLDAVTFTQSQLGKPYQYLDLNRPFINRSKDPNVDSEAWYCTELIWAAYYQQGINIDSKGMLIGPVMPADICWDDDISMYTWHQLNQWYLGLYANWAIYILKNPR
jgi:uncharacterized protein YycO